MTILLSVLGLVAVAVIVGVACSRFTRRTHDQYHSLGTVDSHVVRRPHDYE